VLNRLVKYNATVRHRRTGSRLQRSPCVGSWHPFSDFERWGDPGNSGANQHEILILIIELYIYNSDGLPGDEDWE